MFSGLIYSIHTLLHIHWNRYGHHATERGASAQRGEEVEHTLWVMRWLVVHHWGCRLNNEAFRPREVAYINHARERTPCQLSRAPIDLVRRTVAGCYLSVPTRRGWDGARGTDFTPPRVILTILLGTPVRQD